MKQITYEEVSKSIERLINIVQIVDEDDLSELGFEYTNEEFQNDLADARDFIKQHKPPTFDEVVKAWEEIWIGNNTVKVICENSGIIVEIEKMIAYIINLQTGIFQIFEWEMGNYRTSLKVFNAINLSIRYLQAKEKEND